MIALIGIILLIGIVKKNGIMMVDFALDAEREEGKAPVDAIYQACLLRFRPIIMTTIAMTAGMLPIALGIGSDPSFRSPMSIAVIGGLMTSTMLSLLVIPAVFTYIDDLAVWLASRRSRWSGKPRADANPVKLDAKTETSV